MLFLKNLLILFYFIVKSLGFANGKLIYSHMMPNEQIIPFQGIATVFMASTQSFRNF